MGERNVKYAERAPVSKVIHRQRFRAHGSFKEDVEEENKLMH